MTDNLPPQDDREARIKELRAWTARLRRTETQHRVRGGFGGAVQFPDETETREVVTVTDPATLANAIDAMLDMVQEIADQERAPGVDEALRSAIQTLFDAIGTPIRGSNLHIAMTALRAALAATPIANADWAERAIAVGREMDAEDGGYPLPMLPLIFYDSPDQGRRLNSLADMIEANPGASRFSIKGAAQLAKDLRALSASPAHVAVSDDVRELVTRLHRMATRLNASDDTRVSRYGAGHELIAIAEALALANRPATTGGGK